ncbi:pancreatic triacylglycerol lipase-like [Mizuhopecten yessoensis]|uniref:Pancreatic triacylglycerol lipase n=1 Tax=Mizuhopecten yessoensis TaxID=6573 RepID=A0A210PSA1_MIZYE|nr:pancreatic triacylglycerol lipase-like [Mizuhopecten yessoensis]OWF39326.1 Pancreatic triacylglycerol lipase [Mizuhopecten yessoensis]
MLTLVFVCCVVFVTGRGVTSPQTECLPEFGCFISDGIVPVPQQPAVVDTHLKLFTRSSPHSPRTSFAVDQFDSHINKFASLLDTTKDTKVIVHGYIGSGSMPWVVQITSELLLKGDFNVIVVDWQTGSQQEYNLAVGNSYLVGAEVAKVLTYLHDNRTLDYVRVHIIGHSLGGQIAGHIGYRIKGIGRISGLDPAEPDFRDKDTSRRLDQSDATFVDIIHTDGSKFKLLSGYGFLAPMGHVDFYPNGGQHQPGCDEKPIISAIDSILHGSIGGATRSVTCSHNRAVDLYIESINSACRFYGHTCSSASKFDDGSCMGCSVGGCPVMGYDSNQTSQRGSFYLSTAGSAPFCAREYYVEIHVSHLASTSYGELLVTLTGMNGGSEEIKFSPRNEYFRRDQVEKHVIGTNTDIGHVKSLRVKYVEPSHNHHTSHTAHEIRLHSVIMGSTERSNDRVKFCGHENGIHPDGSLTLSSSLNC